MRWLWKPFSELQEALDEDVAPGEITVSRTPSKSTLRPKQINDHVYEVHKPEGIPSVELVFFHGLQLEAGSSEEAHMNTWVSQDKSESWLKWLLGDIPEARILTISYDAAARTTKTEGRGDMYLTGENLVHSLTGDTARVGQDGCPVVFVGHCLGGLVMKEVCLQAFHLIRPSKPVEKFLANLKGLFFLATPHHGSLLADYNKHSLTGPLIKALETLEEHTARRNEEFRQLRKLEGWKTCGVGELLPVKLKFFEGILVPEASARSDMDIYYGAAVDHYSICRPVNKQSSIYQMLLGFIRQIVEEQTEELDLLQWTIPDSPRASEVEVLLGPRQLWVLNALKILLFIIHLSLSPLIFFVSMSSGMSSEMDLKSLRTHNEAEIGLRFGLAATRTILLLALNLMSAVGIWRGCRYLLTLCMTRRWAHSRELPSEVKLYEIGSELDEESSKLVEVGHLQQQEKSRIGVGSRHKDDLELDTKPSLLEQQLEAKVEVDPLVLREPLPSRLETQIDVSPSPELIKQTRRLRSRGASTNKSPEL